MLVIFHHLLTTKKVNGTQISRTLKRYSI